MRMRAKNQDALDREKLLRKLKAENKALRKVLESAPKPRSGETLSASIHRTWYNGPRKDALEDGRNLPKSSVRHGG